MKRVLLILAGLMTALTLSARVPHLAFKGVQIDGNLKNFTANMEKKGFEVKATGKGMVQMEGDFAGYKNCLLNVTTLYQKDLVSFITLNIPYRTTWTALEADYTNLKDMLTIKYGEPVESEERFLSRVPKNDSDRLYELGMDRCVYTSLFRAPYGEIRLTLCHNSSRTFHVELKYVDRVNSEIIKSVAIGDL